MYLTPSYSFIVVIKHYSTLLRRDCDVTSPTMHPSVLPTNIPLSCHIIAIWTSSSANRSGGVHSDGRVRCWRLRLGRWPPAAIPRARPSPPRRAWRWRHHSAVCCFYHTKNCPKTSKDTTSTHRITRDLVRFDSSYTHEFMLSTESGPHKSRRTSDVLQETTVVWFLAVVLYSHPDAPLRATLSLVISIKI